MNKLKVNEIFESLQGEGKFAGFPTLFIRLSGCTRHCKWCDSKYHTASKDMTVSGLGRRINKYEGEIVTWTGGEPVLQLSLIKEVKKSTSQKYHCLESNADLVKVKDDLYDLTNFFNYLCFSPKTKSAAKRLHTFISTPWYDFDIDMDIKVVTDLDKVGVDLLPYATMVMPLTVENDKENKQIQQRVWNYCVEKRLKYSPRLHVDVWGVKRRGV